MRRVLAVWLVCAVAFSAGAAETKTLNVLFIGNSYTHRHDMPQVVKAMAAFRFDDYLDCVDPRVECANVTITGAMLRDHDIDDLVPAPCGRPERTDFYLGVDLGYTRDPSELVVYADTDGRLTNIARLHGVKPLPGTPLS